MTLTEQWKKGELKEGVYYVRNEYDVVFAAENYINYDCFNDTKACDFYNVETNIKEVLAPVPSYEEWQELVQDYSEKHDKYLRLSQTNHQLHKFLEEFNALDVAKENQQLKALLKEWIHFYPIILYEHEDTLKTKDIVELFDKTREVLK